MEDSMEIPKKKKKLGTKPPYDPAIPLLGLHPAAAKLLQSRLTLCNPIDGSPPGSPTLGFSRQEHWSGLPLPSPIHPEEIKIEKDTGR